MQRAFQICRELILLCNMVFVFPLQAAPAVSAGAVTSLPGPKLHVVVTWQAAAGVKGINIYRKTNPLAAYPTTPLNTLPVQVYKNCAKIKAVIQPGSTDWVLLAKTFASGDTALFNPCQIATILPTEQRYQLLEMLARARWKIALVAGLAYDDKSISSGTTYYYQLRDAANSSVLATDIKVTAGSPVVLPAPSAVQAKAGDNQVLTLWGNMTQASGFNVYRSLSPGGPFQRINEMPSISRFQLDPEGKVISPDSAYYNGFLDFLRRDSYTKLPTTHLVNGNPVSGPLNGTTYYYKVAAIDLLGNEGAKSSPAVAATPQDKTPPRTPQGISVVPDESTSSLQVQWTKVTLDVNGYPEQPAVAGYRVYRYQKADDPATGATAVGGLVPQPTLPGITTVSYSDNSPGLRSTHGEKTYWYRVEAVDAASNVSARSSAAGGFLKDITAPDPPVGIGGKGFDDYIRVEWDLNSEPDMDGYNLYRSYCDFGDWVECEEVKPAILAYTPRPCSGPFVYIGYLSQGEARNRAEAGSGKAYFEDRTVPDGSPVCYAYLVKALDRSQNMSGNWPIPDTSKEKILCERLRDRKPPEPAFISKLLARDNSVLVEWIGAPVQDIKAYHVYRAEKEGGPFKWVGGMTVGIPPAPGVSLSAPYEPPPGKTVGCDSVPLAVHEGMSAGSLIDKSAEEHVIYWYKVTGIDQNGNESPLDSAVAVSTFTYSMDRPQPPLITTISPVDTPCALRVEWIPPYDPQKNKGFLLFRNFSENGVYQQLGSLITTNSYLDSAVVANRKYWYKVLWLDSDGVPSTLSPPKYGQLSP